jgi:hypothetical protein
VASNRVSTIVPSSVSQMCWTRYRVWKGLDMSFSMISCHGLGFLLNTGSTIAATLYESTHIYRVNTPILSTTSVQSVNIPHMRTVHTPRHIHSLKAWLVLLLFFISDKSALIECQRCTSLECIQRAPAYASLPKIAHWWWTLLEGRVIGELTVLYYNLSIISTGKFRRCIAG